MHILEGVLERRRFSTFNPCSVCSPRPHPHFFPLIYQGRFCRQWVSQSLNAVKQQCCGRHTGFWGFPKKHSHMLLGLLINAFLLWPCGGPGSHHPLISNPFLQNHLKTRLLSLFHSLTHSLSIHWNACDTQGRSQMFPAWPPHVLLSAV